METYCSTDMIERAGGVVGGVYRRKRYLPARSWKAPTYRRSPTGGRVGDELFVPILTEAPAPWASLRSLINLYSPKLVILSGTLFDAAVISIVKRYPGEGRLSAGVLLPEFRRRNISDPLFEIGAYNYTSRAFRGRD